MQNIKVTYVCDSCQHTETIENGGEMKGDWYYVNVTVIRHNAVVKSEKLTRAKSPLVCYTCKLIMMNEEPVSLSFFEKVKGLFGRKKRG